MAVRLCDHDALIPFIPQESERHPIDVDAIFPPIPPISEAGCVGVRCLLHKVEVSRVGVPFCSLARLLVSSYRMHSLLY